MEEKLKIEKEEILVDEELLKARKEHQKITSEHIKKVVDIRVKMLKSLMGEENYNETIKNGGIGLSIKNYPKEFPIITGISQSKEIITFLSEAGNIHSERQKIEVLETTIFKETKERSKFETILSARNLT